MTASGVLQCVAVCCSVLQCVVVWKREAMQKGMTASGGLQCVAVFCSVSLCFAECCTVLQRGRLYERA